MRSLRTMPICEPARNHTRTWARDLGRLLQGSYPGGHLSGTLSSQLGPVKKKKASNRPTNFLFGTYSVRYASKLRYSFGVVSRDSLFRRETVASTGIFKVCCAFHVRPSVKPIG